MSPDTVLDRGDVVRVTSPADIENNSHLDFDTAGLVLDLARVRASNRKSGRSDAIITLDEWALDEGYGPIAEHRVLFASKVEDYSEKAYATDGAFYVDMGALRDNPNQAINHLVEKVDERDEGANEKGEKFLPKSVVDMIGSVE